MSESTSIHDYNEFNRVVVYLMMPFCLLNLD
jgi:hypothetical protein